MPTTGPDWVQLAIYAGIAALAIMVLQRLPVVGRIFRVALSFGLLAFFIFILLRQAPYQPGLERFTQRLGLDDQQVVGKEVRVRMSGDGHFWVNATVNGVPRRMLIDSGATVTALSERTAELAHVSSSGGSLAPVILRTANGNAAAQTGSIDELRVGNIVAHNLRMVTAPGLGGLDVLGMNFLSLLQSWRVEDNVLVLVPHHPQQKGGSH
jgi:aspartyl protease family protein